MKASIIIPAHNRRQVTVECIRALIAERVPTWAEIIVVDDGSSDGTSEAVAKELPAATVIRGTGDWWWTGAIARGMESALARGGDVVVWLNDDTRPHPGSLSLLCAEATKRQAIVGGDCLVPGTTEVANGGNTRRGFGFDLVPRTPQVIDTCDALSGNMVCVPRTVVERIGFPDAHHLPHAFADLDYTLRARQRGVDVLVVHDATASAVPNAWDNYASWLCSDVSLSTVWRGIWTKRSYAYLPAQWVFFTRHWGSRGAIHVLWLLAKRIPITALRCVTTLAWRQRMWGGRSRAWQEEKRLRAAMSSAGRRAPTPLD
jgi:glycosyltransferase involved in cell wall biosynthesis